LKISAIVTTFEYIEHLGLALESLRKQTLEPSEVIVVDDGSSPAVLKKIKQIVNRSARASKIPHHLFSRPHFGIARALNFGLSQARGKWLTILDSDDIYRENRLERVSRFATRYRSDFVFTDFKLIDYAGNWIQEIHSTRQDLINLTALKARLRHGQCPDVRKLGNISKTTSNFFFKKDLLNKIGGFRDYRLYLDYDFLLRAYRYGRINFCKEDLLLHRVNTKSYSNFQLDCAEFEFQRALATARRRRKR